MMQVLKTLEITTVNPIGDIGNFVHPTHIPGEKMYPIGSRSILLGNKNSPLAEVTESGIKIGNTLFPVETKLSNTEQCIHYELSTILGWGPMMPSRMRLTNHISLNHFGACFQVLNLDEAVEKFVEATHSTVHKIYEDPAGQDENMRWLFIGDKNSDAPMFEIVLPDPSLNIRPHFQIDIDTDCEQERIDTFFPKDFFDWNLDIPGVGKVLQMGTLWNMYGYDIRLGVGNNKRSKQAHRESMIEII